MNSDYSREYRAISKELVADVASVAFGAQIIFMIMRFITGAKPGVALVTFIDEFLLGCAALNQ